MMRHPLVPALLIALAACDGPGTEATVSIGPASPDTRDDLVAAIDGEPGEGTFVFRWQRDGTAVPSLATNTVPASETARGQEWTVRVTVIDDGESDVGSATVVIGNAPPSATVAITPADPGSNDDLVATATLDDPDGDDGTVTWAWTRNGQPAPQTGDTIPSSATTPGDTWEACATPTDGSDAGEPACASVLLGNTAPTITGFTYTPDPATAAAPIQAQVTVDDPDNDPLTYTFTWYVNDADVGVSDAALPADRFARGDTVRASVVVSDGTETASADGDPVTIANAVPTFGGVNVTPTPATAASDLTCTPTVPGDADGDTVSYDVTWFVDGTEVKIVEGLDAWDDPSATLLGGTEFVRTDAVSCTLQGSDETASGVPTTSPVVTVVNAPPTLASVRITNDPPPVGLPMTVTLEGPADADGDPITYTYDWWVEGTLVASGATLDPSNFDVDDEVFAVVTPNDGFDDGPTLSTPTVFVDESRPGITDVTFTPAVPRRLIDLVAEVDAYDPEGQDLTFTWSWSKNGVTLPSFTTDTLPGSTLRRGDEIQVVVVAEDTDGNTSQAFTSQLLVVENTPPSVDAVTILPVGFDTTNTLRCSPSGWEDADDDSANYAFGWKINGAPLPVTSDILAPGNAVKGDVVTCEATPMDPVETGMTVTATDTTSNAPPRLDGATISPGAPRAGQTLSVNLGALTDPDPMDAGSLGVRYQWVIEGVEVAAPAGTQPTLSAGFSRGDNVLVRLTPFDSEDDGLTVSSVFVTVANSAPSVDSVQLTPTSPTASDTIEATVTTSDPDDDPVSLTYSWRIGGSEVVAGQGLSQLDPAYIVRGNVVTVRVTPSDGDLSGPPTTSAGVSVVNAPPGPPAVLVEPRWTLPATEDLRCIVGIPSEDGDGDAVTYSMTWQRDGVAYPEAGDAGPITSRWLRDTVPAADVGPDETWTCTATPADPTAGTPSTAVARSGDLPVRDISASLDFTCAVSADDEMRCWGFNDEGQAAPPADDWVRVDAEQGSTCGLNDAGQARCFGLGYAAPPSTFVEVATGVSHACGITAIRGITCWGANLFGATTAPITQNWRGLAAGLFHTCALDRTTGEPTCWGLDDDGQSTPPEGEAFVQLAAGNAFSCGLRGDGGITCWGSAAIVDEVPAGTDFVEIVGGSAHVCAIDSSDEITCFGALPTADLQAPSGPWALVAPGTLHTCAVRTTGETVCWGASDRGQLQPSFDTWDAIAAGGDHTCGIANDGTVSCWGLDEDGQSSPPVVLQDADVLDLGQIHSCALRDSGDISCWGDDFFGQASAPLGPVFTDVAAGTFHSCALDDQNAAHCWGDDSVDQITDTPLDALQQIAAGARHTCGIDAFNRVLCWGADDSGQSTNPNPNTNYVDVGAGRAHTCAVRATGTTDCWGNNDFDQLLAPGTAFDQIAVGSDHACGLDTLGRISCWGNDANGRTAPPSGSYVDISAGRAHTCATRTDGRNVCWGLYVY